MKWTFGRKMGAGFALACVALIVLSVFGYRSTETLLDNDRLVAHTHLVRKELSDLLSAVQDAETGQRGYLLTGNEAYLEPYQSALRESERLFADIQKLMSDNPEQLRRLESFRGSMQGKLTELQNRIDIRRKEGLEAAIQDVEQSRARDSMVELRRAIAEMDRVEQNLLEQRRASAEASAASTKSLLLWGTLLAVAFVAFSGAVISSSLTKQISAAVQHIQSSSTELQTAANQQATGAREQSTAMTEISTTISELLATSRQIAEGAQRVAQVSMQTAQATQSGSATVERGLDAAGAMRRQVETIVSHMVDLGKKSQQIGAVLDIVSELAEQTNILAINATIEAAGAGDAGKRFAVVADEIRKLADRVGGSTKEVRHLIDDVRSAVNMTVMTTETGSKAVEAGSRQFNDVAASFRQIAAQIATASEAAKEIELSTKQQATAVEQVNMAISNVAQASKESEVSTTQTLRTASELSGLAGELLRIVQPDAERRVARA